MEFTPGKIEPIGSIVCDLKNALKSIDEPMKYGTGYRMVSEVILYRMRCLIDGIHPSVDHIVTQRTSDANAEISRLVRKAADNGADAQEHYKEAVRLGEERDKLRQQNLELGEELSDFATRLVEAQAKIHELRTLLSKINDKATEYQKSLEEVRDFLGTNK